MVLWSAIKTSGKNGLLLLSLPRRNGVCVLHRLNVLSDLNGLNSFKSWTHMTLLLFGTAL